MSQSNATPTSLKFVTGMHRSGTTWVGQMVDRALPGCIIHEPMNAHVGLRGVDKWYYGPKDKSHVTTLIGEMIQGRRSFRRRRDKDGLLKNLARTIGGSRYERDLAAALGSGSSTLLLKDPFLIRVGSVLVEAFDAKGVIMVRHPAALINSLKRMGWTLPALDGLEPGPAQADPNLQFAFDVGRFWSALYAEVETQLAIAPNHLLLVRHEDMCVEPVRIGGEILVHLGIPTNEKAQDFLRVSTSGNAGEMSGNQLHNMHRDARKLVSSWRHSLPPAEIEAVQQGGGATLESIYP